MTAKRLDHGNLYEDFMPGRIFEHHWGRTILASDNSLFCALTMQYSPLYVNAEYAKEQGYRETPVHPLFVWNVVAGLSVEDLTERGGPFLGVDRVKYATPVYPGDTIYAGSEVVNRRLSESRPGWGIVTWHTTGWNQRDEKVIEYERTNLARCRAGASTTGDR